MTTDEAPAGEDPTVTESSPMSDETAANDEQDQAEPGAGAQFPPQPGASVHHSPLSGQATVLADQGIQASDLTSALARFLPANVRLVEATVHAGTVMMVFEGRPALPSDGV